MNPPFTQQFQSTLPHGSDRLHYIMSAQRLISIHAPSRERRLYRRVQEKNFTDFNPRSLTGATIDAVALYPDGSISIHAPSRERLFLVLYSTGLILISIHAPSRERQLIAYFTAHFSSISIHAPSRERLL